MLTPALLLPKVLSIAEQAGAVILQHYTQGTTVSTKADASPVTAADEAGEAVILAALRALTPDVPIVAEEAVSRGEMPRCRRRRLLAGRSARRHQGVHLQERRVHREHRPDRPPATGAGRGPGASARAGLVGCRRAGRLAPRGRRGPAPSRFARGPPQGAVAVASRSHRDAETDAWLAKEGIDDTVSAGSSLKFCLVAEGKADVYPRFGPTMEWDTAAGDAVLRAAGGRVETTDGAPFLYVKPGFRNPGFIARGA